MNRRGIALAMVMTMLGLLTLMTTAFVAINHSNFGLLNASIDQENATRACYDAYAYAHYALENNKRWGTDFSTLPPAESADVASEMNIVVVDPNTLQGTLKEPDGSLSRITFTLTVINNLRPGGAPVARGGFPTVAPETCYIRVVGNSTGLERRLETVFATSPLFDSSALASGYIDIDARNSLTFDSLDKYRNTVRANGDITVPDGVIANRVHFDWTADPALNALPRKGMLWSKGAIRSGPTDLSLAINNPQRQQFENHSKGFVANNAAKTNNIYDLGFDDFKMYDTTPQVDIKPGKYVFGTATYDVNFDYQQLDRFGNPATDFLGRPVMGNTTRGISFPALIRMENGVAQEMWVKDGTVPPPGAPLPGALNSTILSITPQQSAGAEHQIADGIVRLTDIAVNPSTIPAGTSATIDIEGADFNVGANTILNVVGDFAMTSEVGTNPGPGLHRDVEAKLHLGYDVGAAPVAGQLGAIKASGTLTVREVDGNGALVANSDLTMQAGGQVSTDPNIGIALYGNRDVIMDPAGMAPADIGTPGAIVDSKFKGLVYAGRNFEMRKPPPAITNPSSVDIEGALVAKRGNIWIDEATNVKLTYNPIFLTKLVKDRPDDDIRLERQSFNLN